ncbi:MAG: HAD family hydrolase [Methanohalobium sp.]|uniref:HAD family hydrolase n=1 Tax=Methanohalobium sp. TaxID=2837493 RepID=UPI00397D823B
MLKAMIFDFDGVLADSMPYHAQAWKIALEEAGVEINIEDIYEVEGSNHVGIIQLMFKKVGKTPHPQQFDEIAQKKREIFSEISNLETFEDMDKCLFILKKKFKLAVVSGADRNAVYNMVNQFYPDIFDIIVTGEDVDNGKPSPEPYIKALEMLDVQKDECIVVENAPLGVEAAKNAGLYCVAVPTYVGPDKLNKADIVLEDHNTLKTYLHSLYSGQI